MPPRGKSSLYFKVLMILTVHVVLIGGMLLQGCKDIPKESKDTISPNPPDTGYAAASNSNPETIPPVTITSLSNSQVAASQPGSQASAPPVSAPQMQPSVTGSTAAPASLMAGSVEYVIAAGDTFGGISKRQHVSLKALMDANPGVDAKKLRVGQKVQIPAAPTAVAAASGSAPAAETAAADGPVYVVKTGDTLGKIARLHGTSYKKLMALNDLKSTSIRVGQKLKMPSPKPLGADVVPASASTAQPQAAAGSMPVTTTATAPAPTGAAN
jgi:LysM repeat protein